jgi:uncharacterized Zn finger protein
MTIDNFEKSIEPKILERGFEYYEQDYVERVEQIETGEFHAEVQGSELYEVYVRFDGRELIESECDCPYDWGDECKHLVAVLYYIRDAEMLDETATSTIAQQIAERLSNITEQELKDFVSAYAKRNSAFREAFLDNFA